MRRHGTAVAPAVRGPGTAGFGLDPSSLGVALGPCPLMCTWRIRWATVPASPWRRCVAWTFGVPVPSSRATVLSHSGPVHLHLGAVAYVIAPVALPVGTLRP